MKTKTSCTTAKNNAGLKHVADVDVSEERAGILSIVKGLEGQVRTAFQLKEVLEADLKAIQKKLAEEMKVRAKLEAQVQSLEAVTASNKQLRHDVSLAEEERNKTAEKLDRIQTLLAQTSAERDSLAKQLDALKAHAKEIESDKVAFKAQVVNLKDRISNVERLRGELDKMTEANWDSKEQAHKMVIRMKASEKSKKALEKELAGAHQNVIALQKEVEQLRVKVLDTDNQASNLRLQLGEMIEKNTHLENELKMTTIGYKNAKSELDAFKNAMSDIRNEATRTSGRVRQRYLKPSNGHKRSKAKSRTSRK